MHVVSEASEKMAGQEITLKVDELPTAVPAVSELCVSSAVLQLAFLSLPGLTCDQNTILKHQPRMLQVRRGPGQVRHGARTCEPARPDLSCRLE